MEGNLKFSVFLIFTIIHLTLNSTVEYTDFDQHHTFIITGGYRRENHTIVKFMVSIRTDFPYLVYGDNHVCGGSIIATNVILTAAHCLEDVKPNTIMITAGSTHRLQKRDTTMDYYARSKRVHPDFDKRTKSNDIAVIYTIKEIETNEYTHIINYAIEPPTIGSACDIAGWGRIIEDGPIADEVLYARIYILPTNSCDFEKYGITNVLCAGDPNDELKDSCTGDSGGPLVINDTQYGIVSFGEGCGRDKKYGIYTDVSHYANWIKTQVKAANAFHIFIATKNFIAFLIYQFFIMEMFKIS